MHRNSVFMSSNKPFKSILFVLVCVMVLQLPSFGQCNVGVFINEFHYDNVGTDNNEFVEVAVPNIVPIGFNLADYVVTLYNGLGGAAYDNQSLAAFQLGNMDANFTYYVWKPLGGIQNGAPDGIALSYFSGINSMNCEFISYEGTFMATDGPAMGIISTDIGVAESNTTTQDSESLQLINGVWTGPIPATPGDTNVAIAAPGRILISELSVCNQVFELENVGLNAVDLSNWYLCNFPDYSTILSPSVNVLSGSLLLAPGDFVTLRWAGMNSAAGELGLYLPGSQGGFGNADNIIDYVQYNSANNVRAPVAVAAGVWDDVSLGITADNTLNCGTSIANAPNPMASNSTTWCDSDMPTIIPAGTNSACAPMPMCGVSFPNPADISCDASTFGIDNVTVELSYAGIDPSAVLLITVNGTMVSPNPGSDDPSIVMDGVIIFTAQEGTSYTVTFTDALCSSVTSSGIISINLCPGTAICPPVGALIVTEIMYNPSGSEPADEWFEICNTTGTAIDMNGFEIADMATSHTISGSVVVPGNGCIVISHTNLSACGGVATAYQHGAFSLNQAGDQVEISCGGTVIDVVVYDGGTTFPSVGNGEAISFSSAVTQDHITNDNGANWCIATTACGADDFATPGLPNPACQQPICGISSIGNPIYDCIDNTAAVNDAVKVTIPYLGMDGLTTLVIEVNGLAVLYSGNPTILNGTFSFMAQEGDQIELIFTAPCSSLNVQFMVPLNQCPGAALCGISSIGNPIYDCIDNTAAVNDAVEVTIPYIGMDGLTTLVILVNNVPVLYSGNPNILNGSFSFLAEEGDLVQLIFSDPCSSLSTQFMIPTNQCPGPSLCPGALYISGVIDGDVQGRPKAMQLCATVDIPSLSFYGIESVSAGMGSAGVPEYNFPPDPLGGGECIWLSIEAPGFISFFGFAPCYIDDVMDVDGDDALILYCGNQVLDVLGDPNCDPNAFPPMTIGDCGIWEYMDGWVFAKDMVPNPIFNDAEWTYSMEDALDGEINNATADIPYPNPGSGCPICPDDFANGGLPHSQAPLTFILDTNADLEADGDIISDQVIGSLDPDIEVDYDSGTSILLDSNFEVFPGVTFHAFIDGCGGI